MSFVGLARHQATGRFQSTVTIRSKFNYGKTHPRAGPILWREGHVPVMLAAASYLMHRFVSNFDIEAIIYLIIYKYVIQKLQCKKFFIDII